MWNSPYASSYSPARPYLFKARLLHSGESQVSSNEILSIPWRNKVASLFLHVSLYLGLRTEALPLNRSPPSFLIMDSEKYFLRREGSADDLAWDYSFFFSFVSFITQFSKGKSDNW